MLSVLVDDEGPARPGPRARDELPWAAVLAVVVTGLAATATGHWRTGAGVLGLGLLLAAGLRLGLPPRSAGWLVVRSRSFDATLLLALGLGVLALAVTIPRPA